MAAKHPKVTYTTSRSKKQLEPSNDDVEEVEPTEHKESIADKLKSDNYPPDSIRNRYLNEGVLNFLVHYNLPISVVDDSEFKAMLKRFDKRYHQR